MSDEIDELLIIKCGAVNSEIRDLMDTLIVRSLFVENGLTQDNLQLISYAEVLKDRCEELEKLCIAFNRYYKERV